MRRLTPGTLVILLRTRQGEMIALPYSEPSYVNGDLICFVKTTDGYKLMAAFEPNIGDYAVQCSTTNEGSLTIGMSSRDVIAFMFYVGYPMHSHILWNKPGMSRVPGTANEMRFYGYLARDAITSGATEQHRREVLLFNKILSCASRRSKSKFKVYLFNTMSSSQHDYANRTVTYLGDGSTSVEVSPKPSLPIASYRGICKVIDVPNVKRVPADFLQDIDDVISDIAPTRILLYIFNAAFDGIEHSDLNLIYGEVDRYIREVTGNAPLDVTDKLTIPTTVSSYGTNASPAFAIQPPRHFLCYPYFDERWNSEIIDRSNPYDGTELIVHRPQFIPAPGWELAGVSDYVCKALKRIKAISQNSPCCSGSQTADEPPPPPSAFAVIAYVTESDIYAENPDIFQEDMRLLRDAVNGFTGEKLNLHCVNPPPLAGPQSSDNAFPTVATGDSTSPLQDADPLIVKTVNKRHPSAAEVISSVLDSIGDYSPDRVFVLLDYSLSQLNYEYEPSYDDVFNERYPTFKVNDGHKSNFEMYEELPDVIGGAFGSSDVTFIGLALQSNVTRPIYQIAMQIAVGDNDDELGIYGKMFDVTAEFGQEPVMTPIEETDGIENQKITGSYPRWMRGSGRFYNQEPTLWGSDGSVYLPPFSASHIRRFTKPDYKIRSGEKVLFITFVDECSEYYIPRLRHPVFTSEMEWLKEAIQHSLAEEIKIVCIDCDSSHDRVVSNYAIPSVDLPVVDSIDAVEEYQPINGNLIVNVYGEDDKWMKMLSVDSIVNYSFVTTTPEFLHRSAPSHISKWVEKIHQNCTRGSGGGLAVDMLWHLIDVSESSDYYTESEERSRRSRVFEVINGFAREVSAFASNNEERRSRKANFEQVTKPFLNERWARQMAMTVYEINSLLEEIRNEGYN